MLKKVIKTTTALLTTAAVFSVSTGLCSINNPYLKTTKTSVTSAAVDITKADAIRAADKVIMGYWGDWGISPSSLPWGSVTHINYAFGGINSNYTLRAGSKYTTLADARNTNDPNVKLFMSVGGAGDSATNEFRQLMLGGEDSWIKFADSCIEFLQTSGYNGIDIDYEFPSKNWEGGSDYEFPAFNKFMVVLRDRLKAANSDFLLTMAGTPSSWTIKGMLEDGVMNQDYLQTLDWVNIMTYDYHGGWGVAGHNSPIYTYTGNEDSSLCLDWSVKFHLNYLPPEKIVLGAPYYYRSFSGVTGWGQKGSSAGEGSLTQVDAIVAAHPEAYRWDDEAKVPFVVYGDTVYTYEDERSISEKVNYVFEKGLKGYMAWELSQNPSGSFSKQVTNEFYERLGNNIPVTQTTTTDIETVTNTPITQTTITPETTITTAAQTTAYINEETTPQNPTQTTVTTGGTGSATVSSNYTTVNTLTSDTNASNFTESGSQEGKINISRAAAYFENNTNSLIPITIIIINGKRLEENIDFTLTLVETATTNAFLITGVGNYYGTLGLTYSKP